MYSVVSASYFTPRTPCFRYLLIPTALLPWTKCAPIRHRTELTKRLQQECAEAFGLCCAGHINRLCNVMVGFDDRFVQEVKKGDTTVLQNRFAQIAQIEDDVEKYIQATRVIAEQGLTTEEAAPWLDSLA